VGGHQAGRVRSDEIVRKADELIVQLEDKGLGFEMDTAPVAARAAPPARASGRRSRAPVARRRLECLHRENSERRERQRG
jgi:hypothetical protein